MDKWNREGRVEGMVGSGGMREAVALGVSGVSPDRTYSPMGRILKVRHSE